MKLSNLPDASFIHPDGQNHKSVNRLFQEVISMLLAHAESSSRRPPLPAPAIEIPFGEIPEEPIPEKDWIRKLQLLLEGSMNAANPGFIAHMNSIPTTASILGDLAASISDNNMLSFEMSPSFSRLERWVMTKFCEKFGIGGNAGGVLVGGGSLANLQALTVARNRMLGTKEDGLIPLQSRPVLLASEAAHTSLKKAAMILGLGSSAVIAVAADRDSRMNVNDLKSKIDQAVASGSKPFAVVGTAGTTITGNIDPLNEISEIARRYDLWFHVDAAYGGALIFSRKHSGKLSGIEKADSITFNPQKWLYVARTCSMALFRNRDLLNKYFRIDAPYMSSDPAVPNIGEISVHGTNRADILKLWLSLQHLGIRGYEELIDEGCRLTEYFVKQIHARPRLELASQPETNLVCFRAQPEGVPEDRLGMWNRSLQERLLRDHSIFVSFVPYRNQQWLRVEILNPFTEEALIDRIFDCLDQALRNEPFSSGNAIGSGAC